MIFVLVLVWNQALTQPPQSNGLMKRLLKDGRPISDIVSYNYMHRFFELPDAELPYIKGIHQFLVKGGNSLYMVVDGTGRIYRVEESGSRMNFIRLDSTRFFGYNFGFIPFCYNDTIYSLGGYGFWKFNGQLREFIESKGEWELAKLNVEIPFARFGVSSSPLYWLSYEEKKLYVGYTLRSNEGIRSPIQNARIDSAFVLDLKDRKWTSLGAMNKLAREKTSDAENLPGSPWGQLVHSNLEDKFYLLNFAGNSIMTLNAEKSRRINQLVSNESILYFKDSVLFIGTQDKSLDSISMRLSDFTLLAKPLYFKRTPRLLTADHKSTSGIVYALMALVFVLFAVLVFRERKFRKLLALGGNRPDVQSSTLSEIFTETERAVIIRIYESSLLGKVTTIDDLNTILGVTQKSIDLQKKHRSDIIISVNKKFRFVKGTNDLLINKRRSDGDKRSFEYFVEHRKLADIRNLMDLRAT